MLWWDYVLKILDNTRSFVPVFVQSWMTCNQIYLLLAVLPGPYFLQFFWDFSSFWNFRACQQINNIDGCSKRFSLKQLKILSNLFFFPTGKDEGEYSAVAENLLISPPGNLFPSRVFPNQVFIPFSPKINPPY